MFCFPIGRQILRLGNTADRTNGLAGSAVYAVGRFDNALAVHFRDALHRTDRFAGSAVYTFVFVDNPWHEFLLLMCRKKKTNRPPDQDKKRNLNKRRTM